MVRQSHLILLKRKVCVDKTKMHNEIMYEISPDLRTSKQLSNV